MVASEFASEVNKPLGVDPIQDAVVFKPIRQIFTSQSRWLISFVLKLDSYERFLLHVGQDILTLETLIQKAKASEFGKYSLHVRPRQTSLLEEDMLRAVGDTEIPLNSRFKQVENVASGMNEKSEFASSTLASPVTPSTHRLLTLEEAMEWSKSHIPPQDWTDPPNYNHPFGPTGASALNNDELFLPEHSHGIRNKRDTNTNSLPSNVHLSDQDHYDELFTILLNDCSHLKVIYSNVLKVYSDMINTLLYDPQAEHDVNVRKVVRRMKRFIATPLISLASGVINGIMNRKSYKKVSKKLSVLEESQKKQLHVLSESLSLMDLTYTAASVNRLKITELVRLQMAVRTAVSNVTLRFDSFHNFMLTLEKISLITTEVRESLIECQLMFTDIKLQISVLANGKLSPLVVMPTELQSMLSQISKRLPHYLRLPRDEDTELWYYYKNIKTTTLVVNETFLIMAE